MVGNLAQNSLQHSPIVWPSSRLALTDMSNKSERDSIIPPVLRILRVVYPGSQFSHLVSRVKKIPSPGSTSASKNRSNFNPKNCFYSKLSEIWSGMLIPDPDLDFYPSRIPNPGSRGQKGTGSRIPDPQLHSTSKKIKFLRRRMVLNLVKQATSLVNGVYHHCSGFQHLIFS